MISIFACVALLLAYALAAPIDIKRVGPAAILGTAALLSPIEAVRGPMFPTSEYDILTHAPGHFGAVPFFRYTEVHKKIEEACEKRQQEPNKAEKTGSPIEDGVKGALSPKSTREIPFHMMIDY